MSLISGWKRAVMAGWCWVVIACGTPALSVAQDEPAPGTSPQVMPLWADGVPGAPPADAGPAPSLTLYRPAADKATGAAVVVCPGGGYGGLADHEGKPIAEWFNKLGVTAVVLRYRLGPKNHHPAMLEDAGRAIRTTRANAAAWGIDPGRVAIIGFSAGGHLASTAATHFDAGNSAATDPIDRQSSRPDRAMLIYPVISMKSGVTHEGSRRNLLGVDPAPDLVELLSNETQVTSQTPPTFLVQTDEDVVVPAENSLLFTLALRKAKVPVELHLFEKGRHGLGLGPDGMPYTEWKQLAQRWLDAQGWLKPQP